MTYRLTDEAREHFSWTERRRIQLAQFLSNLADWIQPTSALREYNRAAGTGVAGSGGDSGAE